MDKLDNMKMRSRRSPTTHNYDRDDTLLSSMISTSNDESIIELITLLKTTGKDNDMNNNNNDDTKHIDNIVTTLKHLLDNTKAKERKLLFLYDNVYESYDIRMLHIEKGSDNCNDVGDNDDSNLLVHKFDNSINESTDSFQCPLEQHNVTFKQALWERVGWLIGLLAFQSCSSFILAANEKLIQAHPTIIYFLTMLVGAGGNAGNQSSVRIIRGLAIGAVNDFNIRKVLVREVIMAFCISSLLGVAGFIRCLFSFQTTLPEKFAITTALVLITFISITLGALLPLLLKYIGIDPAHASTSIQVVMDITGVLITCVVSYTLLDTAFGRVVMFYTGASSV
jgi:cation transporter-like permease